MSGQGGARGRVSMADKQGKPDKKAKPEQGGVGVEQGLEELEGLVRALEGGSLPLDEAMRKFERGVELVRSCREQLKNAEERIQMLVQRADGGAEAVPADLDGDRVRPAE